MLSPSDLAELLALDNRARAARDESVRLAAEASGGGALWWLRVPFFGPGLAAAQLAADYTAGTADDVRSSAAASAKLYALLHAQLNDAIESPDAKAAAWVQMKAEGYRAIIDGSAGAAAAVEASRVGTIVGGTVKDTAATVINPFRWPGWLWGVVALVLVVLAAPVILATITGALARRATR